MSVNVELIALRDIVIYEAGTRHRVVVYPANNMDYRRHPNILHGRPCESVAVILSILNTLDTVVEESKSVIDGWILLTTSWKIWDPVQAKSTVSTVLIMTGTMNPTTVVGQLRNNKQEIDIPTG